MNGHRYHQPLRVGLGLLLALAVALAGGSATVSAGGGHDDHGPGTVAPGQIQTLQPNAPVQNGAATVKTVTRTDPSTGERQYGVTPGVHKDGSTSGGGGSSSSGGDSGTGGTSCITTYGAVQQERTVWLPPVQINAAPTAFGVTGAESWFWAVGYNGGQTSETIPAVQQVTVTCTAADGHTTVTHPPPIQLTLDAAIWPESYTWTFGDEHIPLLTSDGKPATMPLLIDCSDDDAPKDCSSGLGTPVGAGVKHTYEVSSAHDPNGYQVQISMTFLVRLTLNGSLVGTYRVSNIDYARPYSVREVESLLTH